jgi:uncharacterized membrane protein YkvA (DUF1232 family)
MQCRTLQAARPSRVIDARPPSRHRCAVPSSLPRYVFTGSIAEIARHVPSFARLYWRLFRDRRVGWLPKALLLLIGIYVLSPLDVMPDLVPVVGAMDDLAVALGGLWLFVQLSPPAVVREHVHRIALEAETRTASRA